MEEWRVFVVMSGAITPLDVSYEGLRRRLRSGKLFSPPLITVAKKWQAFLATRPLLLLWLTETKKPNFSAQSSVRVDFVILSCFIYEENVVLYSKDLEMAILRTVSD